MGSRLALIDERRFIPATTAQAEALYYALVDKDVSVAQARGIVTWLIVLPEHRADDPASDKLRWDYRQALAKLGSPPWESNEAKGAYLSPVSKRLHDLRRNRRRNRKIDPPETLVMAA